VDAKDVQKDLDKVSACVKETKTFGTLISEIVEIVRLIVFIMPMQLKDQYFMYMNGFSALAINLIVLMSKWAEKFSTLLMPLLELHLLTR